MNTPPLKQLYLHLISDATGTTLQGLARACLAQFDNIDPVERFWPLVRTEKQLERVMADITDYPGPVLYTLMDQELRRKLERHCKDLGVPCMAVMDPIIKGLSAFLGQVPAGIPGLQHVLDEAYFHRVDAVDFALSFDDGQNLDGIEEADVILVGVSRTSKTPTCIFLARRGIRAANVPFVPDVPFPDWIKDIEGPLIVGLTESPDRLVNLRRTRLRADEDDKNHGNNTYLDPDRVEDEIRQARRYFSKNGWPVIDVTKRSIEETAAEVQLLLQRKSQAATQKDSKNDAA